MFVQALDAKKEKPGKRKRSVVWTQAVEYIMESRKLFTLRSFAEDTAARSPGGAWGDVETLAVQVINI